MASTVMLAGSPLPQGEGQGEGIAIDSIGVRH